MLTELFSSKTRIRLLLKLFLNADVSCYLRELAQEFQVAPSTLKSELDSLSRAGYLSKKQNGRSTLFQANKGHPLFPEIHSIVRKSLGIDALVDKVKDNLGQVEAVYILDDYARGNDSGLIDLLIVGEVDREQLNRYIELTERKINRRVRALVESPGGFQERQGMYFKRPHWKVV
jgi:DNA-binding MarR family transcriptional regulator